MNPSRGIIKASFADVLALHVFVFRRMVLSPAELSADSQCLSRLKTMSHQITTFKPAQLTLVERTKTSPTISLIWRSEDTLERFLREQLVLTGIADIDHCVRNFRRISIPEKQAMCVTFGCERIDLLQHNVRIPGTKKAESIFVLNITPAERNCRESDLPMFTFDAWQFTRENWGYNELFNLAGPSKIGTAKWMLQTISTDNVGLTILTASMLAESNLRDFLVAAGKFGVTPTSATSRNVGHFQTDVRQRKIDVTQVWETMMSLVESTNNHWRESGGGAIVTSTSSVIPRHAKDGFNLNGERYSANFRIRNARLVGGKWAIKSSQQNMTLEVGIQNHLGSEHAIVLHPESVHSELEEFVTRFNEAFPTKTTV